MSLYRQLQRGMGRATRIIHRTLGYRIDYTIITDQTADPKTTITFTNIPIRATALVKEFMVLANRRREIASGGGLFSLEQQPFFGISRETLKTRNSQQDSLGVVIADGTRFTPQINDEFTPTSAFLEGDELATKFVIRSVIEDAAVTASWTLAFEAIFREEANSASAR